MSISRPFDTSEVVIKLKDLLKQTSENDFEMMEACRIACKLTDEILKEYYGTSSPIGFPIDVRGIVKRSQICIYETNLNAGTGFRIERTNGYYRKARTGKHEINLENRDSEFTKRYILAHEFGHFIISELLGETNSSTNLYCADPLFSKKWLEIFADLIAAFLMFPPMLLLDYLEQYTMRMKKQNSYPIDSFAWLTDLSQKAQVSLYFTISSYQYIKIFMCWLYNHQEFLEEITDLNGVEKFKSDYRKFFK